MLNTFSNVNLEIKVINSVGNCAHKWMQIESQIGLFFLHG